MPSNIKRLYRALLFMLALASFSSLAQNQATTMRNMSQNALRQSMVSLGEAATKEWSRKEYDSSIVHFRACISMANEIKDKNAEALYQYNLGVVFNETHDYNKSISAINAATRLYSEANNTLGLVQSYIQLADISGKIGDPDMADHYKSRVNKYLNTGSLPATQRDHYFRFLYLHCVVGQVATGRSWHSATLHC